MADGAISRETMLAGLNDIRLPAEAPGGLVAELLAGAGIGLLLAALAALLLARLTTRIAPRRPPNLQDRIAALASLPGDERALALLRLLRQSAPARAEALTGDLYRPGGTPSPDQVERALLDA